jgi:enoyl-CoA hydratase/carnithine racemase
MNDFKTIKFEVKENGIGILSLNRPDKLNAISFQMEEELHKILDDLSTNLNCRVIILRAEGHVFSAGTDLQEGLILNSKKTPKGYEKFYYLDIPEPLKKKIYHQWRISELIKKLREINQPIIALIQGSAAGGGLGFILASDIRIASSEAKFINASINIGLTGADMGSSYFLPRLIGMSKAAEIIYTGKSLDAHEAENLGLITKIVPKEDLLDAGIEMANNMLEKSPLGLRLTKKAINLSLDSPSLNSIIQFENSSIVLTFCSDDMVEASTAFFGKRKPNYPLK